MMMTRRITSTVGFGAGVGSFKTALWQMGVFNTNQMREPVQALIEDDVASIAEILRQQDMIDPALPLREGWE